MADNSRKDEAQAQFAKLQRANDAKKAMSDYEAEAAATRIKTERLRALRLARDAELAASGTPAAPVKKTKGSKAKPAKGTLSDWIKDREASGHNN